MNKNSEHEHEGLNINMKLLWFGLQTSKLPEDVSEQKHLQNQEGVGEALSQRWGPHDPSTLGFKGSKERQHLWVQGCNGEKKNLQDA